MQMPLHLRFDFKIFYISSRPQKEKKKQTFKPIDRDRR